MSLAPIVRMTDWHGSLIALAYFLYKPPESPWFGQCDFFKVEHGKRNSRVENVLP
jgi:hypothetical protein